MKSRSSFFESWKRQGWKSEEKICVQEKRVQPKRKGRSNVTTERRWREDGMLGKEEDEEKALSS